MTDLYQTRVESDGWTAKGPIYVLNPVTNDIILTPTAFTGRWLITSDLYVTGGACVLLCPWLRVGRIDRANWRILSALT